MGVAGPVTVLRVRRPVIVMEIGRVSQLSACADCRGQLCQQSMRFVPVDAGIGNALPIGQWLSCNEALRSGDKIAFQHHAHDAAVTGGNLPGNIAADSALLPVVFAAVGMAAIDHDARLYSDLFHLVGGRSNGGRIVVRRLPPAAQNDVAVGIPRSEENRRLSIL